MDALLRPVVLDSRLRPFVETQGGFVAQTGRLRRLRKWTSVARAKRSAHVGGGVGHGVRTAGLADMAVDPDALKHAEGEKD